MDQNLSKISDGVGTPIVFISGFLETSAIWASLLRRQKQFLPSVYTLALPGHPPWITHPSNTLDDRWVRDCADAISHQIPGGARLVGHSTGGLAALAIARQQPDIVSDMMLIGALHAGDVGGHKTFSHAAAELPWIGPYLLSATLKLWLSSRVAFEAGLASVMSSHANVADMALEMRDDMITANPALLYALLKWMATQDGADLSRVTCPITSIIGSDDKVIAPEHQIDTLSEVANAHAVMIPTGHLPFIENPSLFDPLFRSWLAAEEPARNIAYATIKEM